MKYSNFLSKLGHILYILLWFILMATPIPAAIVFLVYIFIKIEFYIFGFLIPVLLAIYPIMLNWFLGKAFKAKFYNTGYVHDGESVLDIVRDKAYYNRAKYVNMVMIGLYILLVGYFVFVVTKDSTSGFIGIILSIIGAVIYFIFLKSAIEKSGAKKRKKEQSQITK